MNQNSTWRRRARGENHRFMTASIVRPKPLVDSNEILVAVDQPEVGKDLTTNPEGDRGPMVAARPQAHAAMGSGGSSPSFAGMPAGATTPRPWWILDIATSGTTVIAVATSMRGMLMMKSAM